MPYFHVVFTLPHALNPLAQGNPRVLYRLLFQAAAETLQAFGRDPKWLGGELGITMVLHTWGQNLNQHLHLHCLNANTHLRVMVAVLIPADQVREFYPKRHKKLRKAWEHKNV